MASSTVPFVRFTDDEIASGGPSLSTLRGAVEAFRERGCLAFENAFDPAFIDELRDSYLARHAQYLDDARHADALTIGPKRFQITVALERPFDHPRLYAHPLVFPVVQEILGQHCILGVFGSVMSLPGAEAQHVHRDHPLLFDDALNAEAPAFAVTMLIPLVDLDERTGTTRMWVGSHRVGDGEAPEMPFDDPLVAKGGCALFDLRLLHGGRPNTSDIARPMLYNAYYRPWFVDARNYTIQRPLVVSRETFARMPRANQRLLQRAETPSGERLTQADPYSVLPP